ncbi:MAG TPA: flagellar biosynthesis anti-sigma factor FlgM [Terracidiphilus sp.]|nr:flagellar biosynthesis anti-sigma factor FlgM [Terracidiphilus sp.]
MRIDLNTASASEIVAQQNEKPVSSASAPASGVTAGEDRTTFSSATQSLSSLVSTAMSSPEIRDDKVASLQQAISSGSYKLDPGAIASSMIDEHA